MEGSNFKMEDQSIRKHVFNFDPKKREKEKRFWPLWIVSPSHNNSKWDNFFNNLSSWTIELP